MNNALPIYNIFDTPFWVDWKQRQIIQVANPQNVIPFNPSDRPDGRSTLLMYKDTKQPFYGTLQESLSNPQVAEVRLRNPDQLDLQAAKFGAERRRDYDLDNARDLLRRILIPFQQTENRRSNLKVKER